METLFLFSNDSIHKLKNNGAENFIYSFIQIIDFKNIFLTDKNHSRINTPIRCRIDGQCRQVEM